MKIIKCEQGTPEWHEARKGKMTASNATAIGNCGKGLETYVKEIVRKEISSKVEEELQRKDFERGHELEPIARGIYEMERGVIVDQIGFVERDEFTGCSPDGLVDIDGGLEIKAPDDKAYFEYLIDGENAIDSGYIWQCQMNMLITYRKWWDLIIYNPNFQKSMFIFRILPDEKKFESLEKGLAVGREQIILIKNKLK